MARKSGDLIVQTARILRFYMRQTLPKTQRRNYGYIYAPEL